MEVPDVNKPYGAWLIPDYAKRIRDRHLTMKRTNSISPSFDSLYRDFTTVGLTRDNFAYYLAALRLPSAMIYEIVAQADASLKVAKVLSELGD